MKHFKLSFEKSLNHYETVNIITDVLRSLMLHLLQMVSCVFLFHRQTKGFIGMKNTRIPMPGPLEQAIDFKFIRTSKPIPFIGIENNIKKSFDLEGGKKNLIYWSTHKQYNQSFKIILDATDIFHIVYEGECLNWDHSRNSFIRGTCDDTSNSGLDIYYEVSNIETEKTMPIKDQLSDFDSSSVFNNSKKTDQDFNMLIKNNRPNSRIRIPRRNIDRKILNGRFRNRKFMNSLSNSEPKFFTYNHNTSSHSDDLYCSEDNMNNYCKKLLRLANENERKVPKFPFDNYNYRYKRRNSLRFMS